MEALAFFTDDYSSFLYIIVKVQDIILKFISSQHHRKFIEITYTYMCQNDFFELNHLIRLDRLPSWTFTLTVNDVFM
jgi:hypothetical protein